MTTHPSQWQDVKHAFPECTLALTNGPRLLIVTEPDTFGGTPCHLLAVYQLDADGLPDDTKPTAYAGSDWQAACAAMEEAQ